MDEESLFAAALEKRDPAERAAFLTKACGADPGLRDRMERLLAADEHAGGVLDRAADDGYAPEQSPDKQSLAESPGTVIGHYKLKELIGEGGFGLVFVAEQTHPVRRKVALKVIKPGMDTKEVVARFEAERQALALMEHPNIALVLDGGATDSGRPYFVMELVRGVAITEYCDRNQLTSRERLDLFVSVCCAVQHAHQKGVIHRDLKPSNVLVTLHDGEPVVKVIDFGVAKAINQQLTEHSVYTRFAQMVGTPTYMSPEQAELSGLDIDTRADIYSLGVLLYELLTGTTPFDKERLKTVGFDEIRRIIREEEPLKPSTRISTLGQAACTLSANRKTDPRRLSRSLRGELDWIVMKCLEKDRTRRYETTADLARDIKRYLKDEPVEASPPSAAYRLRKLLRRNRRSVLAGSVLLVVLVGGIVGTTLGLVGARRERDAAESARDDAVRAGEKALAASAAEQAAKEAAETSDAEARAVLGFLEYRILAAMRPEHNGGLGREATLRQAIEAALPFVETGFKKQPLVEARLRMTIGQSFQLVGEADRAAEQFQTARTLFAAHRGPGHTDTLRATANLAGTYYGLGRYAEAADLCEKALALATPGVAPDHHTRLLTLDVLAKVYHCLDRHTDALRLEEEVLAAESTKFGRGHPDVLDRMRTMAFEYTRAGQHPDALRLRTELLALHRAQNGPDHKNTLDSMLNLATTHARLGRHAEGLVLLEDRHALIRARYGPDAPDIGASRRPVAEAYIDAVKQLGAPRLRAEIVALRKSTDGSEHVSAALLASLENLTQGCSDLGRHPDAVRLREELLALHTARSGPAAPATFLAMDHLANAYRSAGQPAEAIKTLEDKLAVQVAKLGPNDLDTLASSDKLAKAYSAARRFADALTLGEDTLARRRTVQGPDHPDTLGSISSVVVSLFNLRRGAEAVPLIDGCIRRAAREDIDPDIVPKLMALRLHHFETTKDADGCRATAEMWEKLNRTDAESLYTAARMRAVAAGIIRGAKPEAATAEADRAMGWLRQAVAAGFDATTRLKGDRGLAALRDREDFIALVADLEKQPRHRETARPKRPMK